MNAFVVVDVQNDFCPGGALAVPTGDQVIPVINKLQNHFELIVATQDWHPSDHLSFAGNHPGKKAGDVIELEGLEQILWPDHCVQGTRGAEFESGLSITHIEHVFKKGTEKSIDSYSGFFDNGHKRSTGLGEYLTQKAASDVFIAGLATDYCVKYSALDALKFNFKVYVIEDACRGIDLKAGDIKRVLAEMKSAGVRIVKSGDVLAAKH